MSVPNQRCFPLSRDPNTFQLILLVSRRIELFETGLNTFIDFNGVGRWIVFMPTRFGVDCRHSIVSSELGKNEEVVLKGSRDRR